MAEDNPIIELEVFDPLCEVEGYRTSGVEMICDCDDDGECCGY